MRRTRMNSGDFYDLAFWNWSEPLKWHTKMGHSFRERNHSGEKAILPEISANGRVPHPFTILVKGAGVEFDFDYRPSSDQSALNPSTSVSLTSTSRGL